MPRTFIADFVDGYNHTHRHTGIGLNTPADIHYGLAAAKAKDRSVVLATARAQNPARCSSSSDPISLALPTTGWINKPTETEPVKQRTQPILR